MFDLLFIYLSFHIFHRVTLKITCSFFSLSPSLSLFLSIVSQVEAWGTSSLVLLQTFLLKLFPLLFFSLDMLLEPGQE